MAQLFEASISQTQTQIYPANTQILTCSGNTTGNSTSQAKRLRIDFEDNNENTDDTLMAGLVYQASQQP
jgi:hypothetical protein